MRATRVAIVDDSPFVCRLLAGYFAAEPDFEVVGTIPDGRRVLAALAGLNPDLVTLDLELPDADALVLLKEIVDRSRIPVLVVSGVSGRAAERVKRAIEAGAADFVMKFVPGEDVDPDTIRRELLSKARAARHLRVFPGPAAEKRRRRSAPGGSHAGIVVIGASTGGPLALRELLRELPAEFPLPVVVVQHMPEAFTAALAAQLDAAIALDVHEALDGDTLDPGHVFIARGGTHLVLAANGRVTLDAGAPVNGHRPSIDVAFASAARAYGAGTHAVLLTGMGSDGALGLASVRESGGRTYVQTPASCIVPSMPNAAMDRGPIDVVARPELLGRRLASAAFAAGVAP